MVYSVNIPYTYKISLWKVLKECTRAWWQQRQKAKNEYTTEQIAKLEALCEKTDADIKAGKLKAYACFDDWLKEKGYSDV